MADLDTQVYALFYSYFPERVTYPREWKTPADGPGWVQSPRPPRGGDWMLRSQAFWWARMILGWSENKEQMPSYGAVRAGYLYCWDGTKWDVYYASRAVNQDHDGGDVNLVPVSTNVNGHVVGTAEDDYKKAQEKFKLAQSAFAFCILVGVITVADDILRWRSR